MAETKYADQFWGEGTPIEGEQLSANGYYTGEHIGKPTQDAEHAGVSADPHYVEHNTVRYGTIMQDASESGANMPDVGVVVTNILTGCTSSDMTGVAAKNKDYEVVYKADSGYTLPSTVTVKKGGSPLTLTDQYTWTQASGTLKVLAANVTDALEITIVATAG